MGVAELTCEQGEYSLGKRCRTVAVEDRDDDIQGDGVGKGKLRVLGAFRNASKCIGSRNCDGGSGSLINIRFEPDFHCRGEQGGPEATADWINLGMKKSSIGGKQYLDNL